MSIETGRPSLHEIGHRRAILLLGAFWGAAPALSFGSSFLGILPSNRGYLVFGTLVTILLGVLYELDSRKLDQYGDGVPMAWSYALVAPVSVVVWATLGPVLIRVPGLGLLGILVGPPVSALLYVWQRGRHASVS